MQKILLKDSTRLGGVIRPESEDVIQIHINVFVLISLNTVPQTKKEAPEKNPMKDLMDS